MANWLLRESGAQHPGSAKRFECEVHGAFTDIQIRLDPRDGTGMRTKRSKVRDIFISRRFMFELYAYLTKMRGERASLRKPNAKALSGGLR